MEKARKQLEREAAKRTQLEKASSNQKAEIAKLKDRNAKIDRELTKALDDLKAREWDVKQLLSKQDKTIVEHVHVLEEAKRVTDRLLQEAQLELRRNEKYIRSLQSAKSKMASEAEDMWRNEKDRLKTRIAELERAYEASTGAQAEQQTQILALHSQVRELRGVLDEAEADRTLLQKARRALQGELEMIKLDHFPDTNKITSF